MIALTSDDTDPALVHVAGELTVYHAAALATDLLTRLAEASGANLAIDLDGVTELDSAGLQVLMVARREARANGGLLRFHRASRPVLDVLDTFQLGDWLAPAAPTVEAPVGEAAVEAPVEAASSDEGGAQS
jgi:anti-sigma B factor antagonist